MAPGGPREPGGSDDPLRLTLSLPGSASLGAYQAGAVAALAVVVDELRGAGRDVCIDGLGGVSAGAIVSLFYAHCLLTGADAPALLRRAWVDDVSSDLLRSRSTRAPLDFSKLEPRLRDELGTPPEDPDGECGRRRQQAPLGLHIGLTNLLGLTYAVDTGSAPIDALSFVDWGRFRLEPDAGPAQLVEPVGRSPLDFALASAAHPLAFAPRKLDRSADRQGYEAQGITNLPPSGALWYSDGGLVESEPVGRTLSAAHAVAGRTSGTRLHLVIDPRSSGPSGSQRWGEPEPFPSWVAGLRRAMSILPTQALHEDLRTVAARNDRLGRVDALVAALTARLDGGDHELRRALAGAAADDEPPPDDAPLEALIRRALERLADVDGMERVPVDTISPLLLARDRDEGVPSLLAGDVIGAFGGFLSRRLRESDFVLGWDSTRAWAEVGLSPIGVDDATAHAIRRRLDERRGPSWEEVNAGGRDGGRLDRHARLELARLLSHMGRIVAVEVLPAALAGRLRRSSRVHGDDGSPTGGTAR